MPIQITCPSCGRALRMKEELAGTLVRCPSCAHEFVARADDVPETGIRPLPEPPARDRDDDYRVRESEPPPRPSRPGRPPHFDDYEDDDDFDDRPRRRRRRVDLVYARERVAGAANGLLAVGWINVILIFVAVGGNLGGLGAGQADGQAVANVIGGLTGVPFRLAAAILIIIGATKMKKLENMGLAKAAAIIAMIPCISICCILGIPFGWHALSALGDPEVVAAFNTPKRPDFDDDY